MVLRLNKFLASVGIAARRKADTMIEQGRVIVNGKKAQLGTKIEPSKDTVEVDGKKIKPQQTEQDRIYILLNKPKGVVSTAQDTHDRKTVTGLVNSPQRLYPVGRLDFESQGLILLTNDGDLAFHLTHPRFHIPKVYLVDFLGEIRPNKIDLLRNGVKLEEGKTSPADVKVIFKDVKKTRLEITLFEGKKRQIRKMAEKLHLHVTKLVRIKMGNLDLGDLQSGKWRNLSKTEVVNLKNLAGLSSPKKT